MLTIKADAGSVIVSRRGVYNLFIELKLRSAAHDDTGYVKSVFTDCYIDPE